MVTEVSPKGNWVDEMSDGRFDVIENCVESSTQFPCVDRVWAGTRGHRSIVSLVAADLQHSVGRNARPHRIASALPEQLCGTVHVRSSQRQRTHRGPRQSRELRLSEVPASLEGVPHRKVPRSELESPRCAARATEPMPRAGPSASADAAVSAVAVTQIGRGRGPPKPSFNATCLVPDRHQLRRRPRAPRCVSTGPEVRRTGPKGRCGGSG